MADPARIPWGIFFAFPLALLPAFPLAFLIVLFLALAPATAAAHPMGSFSVNHYTKLTLTPDSIYVRHLLDLAEVPSFPVLQALDRNADGLIEAHEKDAYLDSFFAANDTLYTCDLNRFPVPLERTFANVLVREGEGGLQQVVIGVDRAGRIPQKSRGALILGHYRDASFPSRVGWKEIAIETRGVTLVRSTVDPGDPTDGLTKYPEDFGRVPPQESEVRFSFGSGDLPAGEGADRFPVPEAASSRPAGRIAWIAIALAVAAAAFLAGRGGRPGKSS